MSTALREIRYALRRLSRSPMFTIAATLTMAIAIGATASVFGLVDGVLLKAFPYREPDRVFAIWESSPQRQFPQFAVAPANYLDWRSQNHSFTTLAAISYRNFTVTGGAGAGASGGHGGDPELLPSPWGEPRTGAWVGAGLGRLTGGRPGVRLLATSIWRLPNGARRAPHAG